MFFIDFICSALFNQWIVSSLLIFLIYWQCSPNSTKHYALTTFWLPLILLLLQDNFLHNRFGIGLVYIAPTLLLAAIIRPLLLYASAQLPPLLIAFAIITENVVLKWFLLDRHITFQSTILKIFINIAISYLVLWCTRGNRSLTKIFVKGRKVWTPNRKDAS